MKGLILKDFYIIRSLLAIICVVFLVTGISLSYLVTPWVLTVLATVMLGMNVTSTINIAKPSGWLKTVITTPVSRKTFINSKYIMYLLLSFVGLLFGLTFGFIATLFLNGDTKTVGLFICISITMAMLSGSIILPFYFLLDESKSIVGTILAYPVSAGIFVVFILLLGDHALTYGLITLISICIFAISWYISKKILTQKDI